MVQDDAKKTNVLSYSAVQTYMECGRKYKNRYVDKIRPEAQSSALFFGTAFDRAIESVLQNRDADEKAIFDTWWQKQVLNKQSIDLVDSFLVLYYASDFDSDLFTADDLAFIKAKASELFEDQEDWTTHYWSCAERRKDGSWTEEENKFFNICNWLSLRRKGHLMLEANRTQVLPKIKKVIATQEKIRLENVDTKDTLVGYPDLVAVWEDGSEIVADYKTASKPYKADAVKTSHQLTTYCVALDKTRGAYFVFLKKLLKEKIKTCKKCKHQLINRSYFTCPNEIEGKRCGGELEASLGKIEAQVDILIDDIPKGTEDVVLNTIEAANVGIKNEAFDMNREACYGPHGPCPYIGLCHKNSMKGLVKV
jgi:hypothetical protein